MVGLSTLTEGRRAREDVGEIGERLSSAEPNAGPGDIFRRKVGREPAAADSGLRAEVGVAVVTGGGEPAVAVAAEGPVLIGTADMVCSTACDELSSPTLTVSGVAGSCGEETDELDCTAATEGICCSVLTV